MKFALNKAGVGEVVRSPRVLAHLAGQAAVVAGSVSAAAPHGSGHFARSITVTAVQPSLEGAKVTVYSTDIAAHIVEYGSINNPAYSPFRRAAASLGLKLKGGGGRP